MKEITKKLRFSLGNRLPMILQSEVTECGLACLAMIASYHGYETDLITLRRQFSISLKGSKLQDLIDICRKLHLLTRAVKLELEDLPYLKTPCLLHWDMDHFVVLKNIRGDKITIHDPAVGVVKYTKEEISKHFTGVAMEITPATDFTKKKDKTKLRLLDLWRSVTGIKASLVQILLLSLALEVFAIVSPQFMQWITDHVLVTNDTPLLYTLAIGFALLMAIQVATEYARSWIVLFMGTTLNIQLTANLFHHLFKLPLSFFEKRHMGDIVSRFGSIGNIQSKITTDFVEGIIDGFMVIITLGVMLIYSIKLSLIVLAALLLYTIIRLLFYPTFKLKNQEQIVSSAKENSIFMESVRAILPIKIFGKESQREHVWQNCYADKLNIGIYVTKLGLIYKIINHTIFGAENIIIMVWGAKMVMGGVDNFTIGMLLAYISYRGQFVSKAQEMIDKIIEYRMITIHLDRVADIALAEPEYDAKKESLLPQAIKGGIKVKNLAFRYSEQDPHIFKNISFEITPGESVAIIGQSGCGKTTLLKILLRLLMPTTGEILIDGVDINKMSFSNYRSQIAAVMQDDTLMSGSIAENIAFFAPNPNLEKIHACAMIAAIHEDILRMPMAYQSLVGDMGTALSGGQKQRILLARALYAQPKILFLDEATSHLDGNNESTINHHIKNIGITRVIVAHRRETVAIADRIIDLEAIILQERQREMEMFNQSVK